MKIGLISPPFESRPQERGFFLMTDLLVGMAILALAIMPLAFSFAHEQRLLRAEYERAVADEIVDGEMEVLVAGAWHDYPEGQQLYSVRAAASARLPAGQFQLTRNANHLRLEWKSDSRRGVGEVVREVTLK